MTQEEVELLTDIKENLEIVLGHPITEKEVQVILKNTLENVSKILSGLTQVVNKENGGISAIEEAMAWYGYFKRIGLINTNERGQNNE